VTTESEPVAARHAADVAYRTAPDLLGQREDLRQGQHRSFTRIFGPGAANPARVWGSILFSGRMRTTRSGKPEVTN
jgi:hypothetical protein